MRRLPLGLIVRAWLGRAWRRLLRRLPFVRGPLRELDQTIDALETQRAAIRLRTISLVAEARRQHREAGGPPPRLAALAEHARGALAALDVRLAQLRSARIQLASRDAGRRAGEGWLRAAAASDDETRAQVAFWRAEQELLLLEVGSEARLERG